MTKEEFEKAMGCPVSEQDYEQAEAVYQACSYNLEEFIKDYKAHKCDLLIDIAETVDWERSQVEQVKDTLLDLAGCIMSEVDEAGENCGKHLAALRDHARIALGERSFVRLCLEKGYPLQDTDREFLLRVL